MAFKSIEDSDRNDPERMQLEHDVNSILIDIPNRHTKYATQHESKKKEQQSASDMTYSEIEISQGVNPHRQKLS